VIEIIAYTSMLVDHLGCTIIEHNAITWLIGRMAWPLFIYMAVLGYHRTSNFPKYALRVLIIAIISQLPYELIFGHGLLNVCFSILVILLIIELIHRQSYLQAAVMGVVSFFFFPSSGIRFAILLGLILDRLINFGYLKFPGQAGQARVRFIKSRVFRTLKYSFYPCHLLLIVFLMN